MQMLCTRNEDIIVAVFFDVKTCVTTSTENQGRFREFLHQASIVLQASRWHAYLTDFALVPRDDDL